MKEHAARGADLRVLEERPNGTVRIEIDGKGPIELGPGSSELLMILLKIHSFLNNQVDVQI